MQGVSAQGGTNGRVSGGPASRLAPESELYTARYRAIATDEAVKVYNGAGCLPIARAMSFDLMDPAFSSVDMVAAAVLSEVLLCISKEFSRCGENCMDLEGRASLNMSNPLAVVGVRGIEGTPIIASKEVDVYLFTFLDEPDARAVIDSALSHAVLYQTFQAAFPVTLRCSFAE